MFEVDQFEEPGLLRVLVDDSVLSAVSLHSVACEHVYHEVLLLRTSSDTSLNVGSHLVDLFLGRIGQVFYVASFYIK